MNRSTRSLVLCAIVAYVAVNGAALVTGQQTGAKKVRLGNFSVSLAVKDLKASREFYEKLGFRAIAGNGRKWLILQNETATIGLFQGMFDKNSLTFNPGWDRNSKSLPEFDDVRAIQQTLKSRGLKLQTEADESSTGPASFALTDPDGNPILVDQHVAKPRG
jgi:lactoylglutathione lyase